MLLEHLGNWKKKVIRGHNLSYYNLALCILQIVIFILSNNLLFKIQHAQEYTEN